MLLLLLEELDEDEDEDEELHEVSLVGFLELFSLVICKLERDEVVIIII